MAENQHPETIRSFHREIQWVKDELQAGRLPSAIANALHSQGKGPLQLIMIFQEATGASLGDLKAFGRWWDHDGVTDCDAFDAWAREVLGKQRPTR